MSKSPEVDSYAVHPTVTMSEQCLTYICLCEIQAGTGEMTQRVISGSSSYL